MLLVYYVNESRAVTKLLPFFSLFALDQCLFRIMNFSWSKDVVILSNDVLRLKNVRKMVFSGRMVNINHMS